MVETQLFPFLQALFLLRQLITYSFLQSIGKSNDVNLESKRIHIDGVNLDAYSLYFAPSLPGVSGFFDGETNVSLFVGQYSKLSHYRISINSSILKELRLLKVRGRHLGNFLFVCF